MRSSSRALALPLLVSGLGSCLGFVACEKDGSSGAAAKEGARVYAAQGCGLCHGSDGAGTSFGPTLLGKAPLWTRGELVSYLKAPVAYADRDPRLAEQKKRYPLAMRQFDHVPEDELAAVADFVLGLP